MNKLSKAGVDKVRPRAKRRKKPNGNGAVGVLFLLVVLVAGAVYFGAAGVVGNWLAQKVVSPLLTTLGVWDDPMLRQGASPSVSASQQPTAEQANNKTPDDTSSVQATVKGMNVFFLQTGAFSTQENAEQEAEALQKEGGAGYIAEDEGKHRVFLATYTQRKDADAVKTQLEAEGIESRVHVLDVTQKTVGVKDNKQKKALEKAISTYHAALEKLGKACLLVDDAAKLDEQAKSAADEMKSVRGQMDEGIASGENAFADDLYELAGKVADELYGAAPITQKVAQHAYASACYEYAALVAGL